MYYAVVNSFHRDWQNAGFVVSRHRTLAAAFAADAKIQRAVQRGAYLPTIIIETTLKVGEWVPRDAYTVVYHDYDAGRR